MVRWLLTWFEEEEEIDVYRHYKYTAWATSWNEVIGYFNAWITENSHVVKGDVYCYLGDEPYEEHPVLSYFNNVDEPDEVIEEE